MQQSQHLQLRSKSIHCGAVHVLSRCHIRDQATVLVRVQVARQLALLPVTARLVEYEYEYDENDDDVLQKML